MCNALVDGRLARSLKTKVGEGSCDIRDVASVICGIGRGRRLVGRSGKTILLSCSRRGRLRLEHDA